MKTFSIQLSRSFSRLKTLVFTFHSDPTAPVAANYVGVTVDPATLALSSTPAGGANPTRTQVYASYKNMDKAQADLERYARMNVNTCFHYPFSRRPTHNII